MSRTLFSIAENSFDMLILNMRRCVSRSNVKCFASAEAAVLQDSSSFSANFFWCIRFALVVVQLLLAIEVHSAHVTKRTLRHGSPSNSSVVKRSRESYLQTSCKHSPKKWLSLSRHRDFLSLHKLNEVQHDFAKFRS